MKKENKSAETSKSNFAKNVIKILLVILVILITCSLFIYKDLFAPSVKISETNIKPHNILINTKVDQTEEKQEVVTPPLEASLQKSTSIASSPDNQTCKPLLSFLRLYHHMVVQIYHGKDFSDVLFELKQFKIEHNNIINNLENLSGLNNLENEYFKVKFSYISRNLYQTKEEGSPLYQYFGHYLKKLFFIKPIGERAKHSSEIDKEIAFAGDALEKNDYISAAQYIKNIPQTEELKDFEQKLQTKITIIQSIENLDKAIFSELNCAMIGQ